MQRWIYSSSKQLLDRVIWAYGFQKGLRFTLFRPFNWIGPKLDELTTDPEKEGSSRVVTQFISNLFLGESIKLVDGGLQKRCFTYIDDGVACLIKIIENKDGKCDGQIFITFGRIGIIPLVLWLIDRGSPRDCLWAAIVYSLAALTDLMDRWLARRMNIVSILGKFWIRWLTSCWSWPH